MKIWPLVRFYELTGSGEALSLAEGLTRWAIEHDPTISPDGEITKALTVKIDKVSASARAKVEAAGGTVDLS